MSKVSRVQVTEIESLARGLMDSHGLTMWKLAFDRARRRAGMAVYSTQTISLSRVLLPLYSEIQVRDVILHEIAHALVGPNHHHDAEWARTCEKIGGTPRTRLHHELTADPFWIGTCPAGHTVNRYRRPSRPASCASCSTRFSPTHAFSWKNQKTGEVLQIHGKNFRSVGGR